MKRRDVQRRALVAAMGGGNPFTLGMNALLQKYGGVWWPLQEASGTVAASYNTALATGRELFIDGNMETAGVAAWTAVNSATLTKEIGTPHGGVQVLRVARNLVNNPAARQTITASGRQYRLTGWTRSDGSAIPRVYYTTTLYWSGTTSTSWQSFDITFTSDTTQITLYAITSTGTEYVEFDDVSITQLNIPANSSDFYGTTSSATPGRATGLPLGRAYFFDGLNDYVSIFTPELNSFFNPSAGTAITFYKVSSASVWTDATFDLVFNIEASANNKVYMVKNNTNNALAYNVYFGVTKQVLPAASTLGWLMLALTWDTAADEARYYLQGVQTGATQTSLGTFTGNLVSNTCIGDIPANSYPTSGMITNTVLLRGAATATEILNLAMKAGVA